MKPVGRLHEFITPSAQLPQGQHTDICIYRRTSTYDRQPTGLTGLLLPVGDAAQQPPACLVYRTDAVLETLIAQHVQSPPDHAETTDGNVLHELWWIDDISQHALVNSRLDQLTQFYPVTQWMAAAAGATTSGTLLLADSQLSPMPCHRLLADLAGMDDYEFLQRLQKCFNIRVAAGADAALPREAREFGLYVAGYWYHLRLIDGTWFHADPVSDLDVSVVHDNMLAPLLGIKLDTTSGTDQGTDQGTEQSTEQGTEPGKMAGMTEGSSSRIAYSTAACTLASLQQRVDDGQWQALWLMPVPPLALLMQIADIGRAMPPNAVNFLPDPVAAALYAAAFVSQAR